MVYINKEEWWPVYVPDPALAGIGLDTPISNKLLERFNANYREFNAIQAELKRLKEASDE